NPRPSRRQAARPSLASRRQIAGLADATSNDDVVRLVRFRHLIAGVHLDGEGAIRAEASSRNVEENVNHSSRGDGRNVNGYRNGLGLTGRLRGGGRCCPLIFNRDSQFCYVLFQPAECRRVRTPGAEWYEINYSPSSHRSDPDDGHPVIEERSGPALVVG